MIARYTLPKMGAIFSDSNKYQKWLEIELLVLQARAELGQIPADTVARMAEQAQVDPVRIAEIEDDVRHDVIAFLQAVAEQAGPDGRLFHAGLTSSDIIDTALALMLRDATDILLEDVQKLMDVLKERALEFRDVPMVGRTHGMHAEPITFGLKLALWYAEMRRHQMRLGRARDAISYGKISGAVGTFSVLDPHVEEAVCRKLGLKPDPISNQVLQRDRHGELMTSLALMAGSLERFATEIRHLQRNEVREVAEPFLQGQKGSSAMPHKRNPIVSEQVVSLARLVRGYAHTALENLGLWHERDLTHSANERVILPDACIALDYMLQKFTWVVQHLHVDAPRMKKNLESSLNLTFSQQVLIALVESGLDRKEAYDWVQAIAMRCFEEQKDFQKEVRQDKRISERLNADLLDQCFSLDRQLRHVPYIFNRVFSPTGAA